jgi:hypothetical protein
VEYLPVRRRPPKTSLSTFPWPVPETGEEMKSFSFIVPFSSLQPRRRFSQGTKIEPLSRSAEEKLSWRHCRVVYRFFSTTN